MIVSIDPSLKHCCPVLQIASVEGVACVGPSSKELLDLLQARAAKLASEGAGVPRPAIAASREAYRALGKDPSRYRCSAEALLRRVVSGKGLYFINNLVEINNLVSLESLLPVGSYDLAKINLPIVFRVGRHGESYKGIGKDLINIADLPVFADTGGPFGSPTSDSERAMITPETSRFAMMVICFSGNTDLGQWAERATELLAAHAGGRDLNVDIVKA